MLNKTPEDKDAKTESAPKKNQKKIKKNKLTVMNLWLLVVLIVLTLFLASIIFKFLETKTLVLNNQHFDVKLVSTSKDREKGLSGTNKLGKNQGMLFKYTDSGVYCMWMKDMKYNIDIIWLDENKKVIDIKKNAEASSYPDVYCPKSDSRFVLELGEGSASKFNIKVGDQAVF